MNAFSWISIAVGVLFSIGVALGLSAFVSARRAVRVRARVLRQTSRRIDLDHNGTGPRVIRFEVEVPVRSGRPVRIRLSESIGESRIDALLDDAGTIPLLHPAGHPERARLDSAWTRYMVPAYLCAPGVLWATLLVYVAIAY